MSELLYYTTAITKGKKPKVMFLNDGMWIFNANNAELMNLQGSKEAAKCEPTHCLFVEAHDGLKKVLCNMLKEKTTIYAEEFYGIVTELGCQTVSTRKKKKSKKMTQKEKEDKEDDNFDEIMSIELDSDLRQLRFSEEAVPLFEKQEDEKREFILYEDIRGRNIEYYYNPNNRYSTILDSDGTGKIASLYTKSEAEEILIARERESFGECWEIGLVEDFRAPIIATEIKKRVCYVLYKLKESGEKHYCRYLERGVLVLVNGKYTDAYRTREDAQFAADILNGYSALRQVEEVEF